MRISIVTLLEVGYSARSVADLRARLHDAPTGAMPVEYATPRAEDRAVALLARLAERGQPRGPSIPDLIIATLAEIAGLVVLHDDKHFDLSRS